VLATSNTSISPVSWYSPGNKAKYCHKNGFTFTVCINVKLECCQMHKYTSEGCFTITPWFGVRGN